jgi:N-acetylglucosamine-6-phosphate deacetylase
MARACPREIEQAGSGLAAILLAVLAGAAVAGRAAAEETAPAEGIRSRKVESFALTGARIVVAPGRVIEKGTLWIEDGKVRAAAERVDIPGHARRIDVEGKWIYAGWIDAHGDAAPRPDEAGPSYWNPSVRPERSAQQGFAPDAATNDALRRQGFTARIVAPAAGIIRGRSILAATSDGPPSRSILASDVALHLSLTSDRRLEGYPTSPMGAYALARQAFHDAAWHRAAWEAQRADPALPIPERNDSLEVLARYAGSGRLSIAAAPNEIHLLRADVFAREFSLALAVLGSGAEYRRLEAVRATGRPIIVPLDFPAPPDVGSPDDAVDVSLRDLMHWDIAPENPGRLEKAGVRIALTSHGLADRSVFLDRLRAAVERGLSREGALGALTTVPSDLFGVSERLGTLEPGKVASFFVAGGDIFEKSARIEETWVAGERFIHAPRPTADVQGRWRVVLSGGEPRELTIELTASGRALEARLDTPTGQAGARGTTLRDSRIAISFEAGPWGRPGIAGLSAVLEAPPRGDVTWSGRLTWPDGEAVDLTAARERLALASASAAEEPPPADRKAPREPERALFPVSYPLGENGRDGPPAAERVLFRGATVWTCGAAGRIEDASMLVDGGTIVAVGQGLEAPAGTRVVDVRGKHITPGIIDCHSHAATDGGINETGQAITAEVRIGDFIDPDDVDIYRQLAGGVTCASVLHGSANPIGGQNQVVKFRWGALPEEMKFREAPPGIKFALGENVKRSNSSGPRQRYPQTRMGVEQIIRDEFEAARSYRRRWQEWERDRRGPPPRRDLELDAIAEVLEGRRWIHCHAYRQDEILAVLRLLDDFGVRIATFQHVLEGYKVADAMARHGAMGSTFSDWWAYKFEVFDAIPYNGSLMYEAGVVTSFNSDDRELARHLNHEAAKAVKYGGVPEEDALRFVTLNPAIQLRIDDRVGSLEPGKHADLVVWSGHPLSILSRAEETWIDGRKYFDLAEDRARRAQEAEMRARLIQKVLSSGAPRRGRGDRRETITTGEEDSDE